MLDKKTARAIVAYFYLPTTHRHLSRGQVIQALLSKDASNRLGYGDNTNAFGAAIADAQTRARKAADPRHNEMLPFFEQRWSDKISKMKTPPRQPQGTVIHTVKRFVNEWCSDRQKVVQREVSPLVWVA